MGECENWSLFNNVASSQQMLNIFMTELYKMIIDPKLIRFGEGNFPAESDPMAAIRGVISNIF